MMRSGNEWERSAELAGVLAAQLRIISHFRLISGTVLLVMRPLGDGPDPTVLARVVILERIRLHSISLTITVVIFDIVIMDGTQPPVISIYNDIICSLPRFAQQERGQDYLISQDK